MNNPTINNRIKIDNVTIREGEVLTVWLQRHDSESCQVELRVTKSGRYEIFTKRARNNDETIKGYRTAIMDFEDWYDCEK